MDDVDRVDDVGGVDRVDEMDDVDGVDDMDDVDRVDDVDQVDCCFAGRREGGSKRARGKNRSLTLDIPMYIGT